MQRRTAAFEVKLTTPPTTTMVTARVRPHR